METLLKSIDLIWRTYRCGSSCEPWGGSSWCTPCRNRPRRICELCASSTRRRIRCPSRGCRRSLRHRRSPFRRSLFRSPALDACGTPWNFEPPIPSRTIGHKTVESFSTSESEFLPGEREGSRGGRRKGCGPLASFATRRVSIPAAICFDRKKFEGRIEPISIRIWIRRRLHRYYIPFSLFPSLPFASNERQIWTAWIYTGSFSYALFIDRCASDYDRFERRKEKKNES